MKLILEKLRRANPHIKIHSARSDAFSKYGQLLGNGEATAMIRKCMESVSIPHDCVVYKPSLSELESHPYMEQLRQYFGQMDIQCGVCMGRNNTMNGLEYHKSSEINIAVTDMVLLLADVRNIDTDNRLDADVVKAFFFEYGDVLELYATTLHFCPCETGDGFCCMVVLPRHTNTPLDVDSQYNEPLLFAKNKWLIAHEENERLIGRGASPGIYNSNWVIHPV